MRDSALTWLGTFVWRRPWAVLVICVLLAIISSWAASRFLRLNADTNDLIARNRPFMKEFQAFMEEFGDTEYIHVVVATGGDAERARHVVDRLTERLGAVEDLQGVYSAVRGDEKLRLATRAMADEDLEGLALASLAFDSLASAETALGDANRMLSELIARGASMTQAEQRRTGAAAVFLLQVLCSPIEEQFDSAVRHQALETPAPTYFVSDTGKLHFITVVPAKDYSTLSVIEEPLEQIRGIIADVKHEFPGIEIGLTGKPVLQADEMSTTNLDMTRSSVLAFVLCAALFMIMFKGIWHPLLAVAAFGVGSAWTYGAATMLLGQLNLLSIVFMLVLIGVGLDYGVHVISRYREFRMTHAARDSVIGAVRTAVRGNLTGALTSSAVFFMAMFTTFQGLRELGLVAGVGLLLCLLAMATVLPALLAITDRGRVVSAPPEKSEKIASWRHFMTRWPRATLGAGAAFTILLALAPGTLSFQYNLLELQASGLPSVEWEHRIVADDDSNTWYGVAIADDLEEVATLTHRAEQRSTIGKVRSVLDLIRPDTPDRSRWRAMLHETSLADKAAERGQGFTPARIRSTLGPLQMMAAAARTHAPQESARLNQLRSSVAALAETVEQQGEAVVSRVEQAVTEARETINAMLAGDRLALREALPDGLRRQYMSPRGRFLVMLHPKDDVWEYDAMQRFVADLRAVDPHATGVPITHFESLGEMQQSFITMSVLALVTIIVILWLDFRNFRDVMLALIPLIIGLAWTVEAMGPLGISFNLANFFSIPILIGLGVDSSVHILHRYHEGGSTRFSLGATRRAVVLTALTTIIGFGCLILAHHRGLRSLGVVMALGSTACLVTSVVILPALLKWLEQRRA